MLNVTTFIPKEYCTPDRLKRLKDEGFVTDGHIYQLEAILSEKGFNLPGMTFDDYGRTYYGFRHEQYIKMFIEYSDSLAEEILFLREQKMI